MRNWSELQSLAEACKGWQNIDQCWSMRDELEEPGAYDWEIGAIDDDGEKYPIMRVDTWQYSQPEDTEKLAKFYAAANPETIQALISDLSRAEGDAMTYKAGMAHVSAERDTLRAEVERLARFEFAWNEWQQKTEWIQRTAESQELGMHRADVLRKRIDQLKSESMRRRKDAERYQWLRDHEATATWEEGDIECRSHPGLLDDAVDESIAAAKPVPVLAEQQSAWVEQVMDQAQVFASAWALVGGPFDTGNGLEQAKEEKELLRALLGGKA